MQRMLIATAVGAAMSLNLPTSQAYQRPWCALTDIGGGVMHENCTIPTFEMCVQEVIAGNRGFCIPNRAGRGPAGGAGRPEPGESASIIDARRRTPVKAGTPKSSAAGFLAGKMRNEAALMKIFPGRP